MVQKQKVYLLPSTFRIFFLVVGTRSTMIKLFIVIITSLILVTLVNCNDYKTDQNKLYCTEPELNLKKQSTEQDKFYTEPNLILKKSIAIGNTDSNVNVVFVNLRASFHSGTVYASEVSVNVRKDILLSCENFHSGTIYSIPTTFNQIERLVHITDEFPDFQISFDLFDRKPCPLDSWVRW